MIEKEHTQQLMIAHYAYGTPKNCFFFVELKLKIACNLYITLEYQVQSIDYL
jgi:hypothetical protein